MNDRDCESCKKFSRNDPHESEGYCQARRSWVDPQEGEDCKMHEFTLHSATKYKDGTPIMSEPEVTYCKSDADLIHGLVDSAGKTDTDSSYSQRKAEKNSMYGKTVEEMSNQLDTKSSRPNQFGIDFCEADCCPYWDKYCDHTLQDKHMCPYLPHDTDSNIKYLEQAFAEFAKTQDELIEEYDATLKTHGDTLEQHKERITINEGNIDGISSEVEDLQRKVYAIYQFLNSAAPDFFFNLSEEIKKNMHKGPDFCGNCTHCDHGKQGDDTVYVCDLSAEIVDPDDSSCVMFEPPF